MMLLSISMNAQPILSPTVISSSGGFYTDGNTLLSFTVAEMTMVQTFIQPTNMLTQGFQQPETDPVSIAENEVAQGAVVIYPNPNNGQFNISYYADNDNKYVVRIYNMVGQVVFTKSIVAEIGANTIIIDIGQYRQGVYMLELMSISLNGKKNSSIHKINLVY